MIIYDIQRHSSEKRAEIETKEFKVGDFVVQRINPIRRAVHPLQLQEHLGMTHAEYNSIMNWGEE